MKALIYEKRIYSFHNNIYTGIGLGTRFDEVFVHDKLVVYMFSPST